LITAPDARDDLTATYRRHLAAGDGPAFLALYAPSLESLVWPPAPPYIFLGPRNHSPTDRPEHFAHPNAAESLIAVWLAADDFSRERQLLQAVGATLERRNVRVPDAIAVDVARLREGDVLLLPAAHQLVTDRRIVGATVRVKSIAVAGRQIDRLPGASPPRMSGNGWSSIFLPPSLTHGLWIELREVRAGKKLRTSNVER
jgi:hypothetical protein